MVGFFIFMMGFILMLVGSQDYRSRGGTDTPYIWEEAVNRYGYFTTGIGLIIMLCRAV